MLGNWRETASEWSDKAVERYKKLGIVGKTLLWIWVAMHIVGVWVMVRYGEAISACTSFFFLFFLLFSVDSRPAKRTRPNPAHLLNLPLPSFLDSPFPYTPFPPLPPLTLLFLPSSTSFPSTGFADLATKIREMPYGWLVLFSIIVVTSVPPLIGYGTAQGLIGFAFGVRRGFYLASASCLAGGAFAFMCVFLLPLSKMNEANAELVAASCAASSPVSPPSSNATKPSKPSRKLFE